MNQTVVQLPDDSSNKGVYRRLQALLLPVQQRHEAGCEISGFMLSYIKRALERGNGPDNLILNHCCHEWLWGSTKHMGVAEFSLISKTLSPGSILFSVKRVTPTTVQWGKAKALGHIREFAHIVAGRLQYRTPEMSQTNVALGDVVKVLIGMGALVVDFRVSKGLHLLVRERPRCSRFLEIYIGGWMDEAKYPLHNYEQFRKVSTRK